MNSSETFRLGDDWYKDKNFWKLYAPFIFGPGRWGRVAEEVDGITALLSAMPGTRILDACCGVGRHSIELAKRGYSVTGVDLIGDYLEAAKNDAESEKVEIQFLERDIFNLEFIEEFESVINMYTSFGYFTNDSEESAFLLKLYQSLKPGGRLLLETLGKENLARDFKESEWYEQDGSFIMAEYKVTDDWSRLQNRWIIVNPDGRHDYTFSHRIYSADEIKKLFLKTGFSQVSVFGNLEGAAYDHKAENLVVLGEK